MDREKLRGLGNPVKKLLLPYTELKYKVLLPVYPIIKTLGGV